MRTVRSMTILEIELSAIHRGEGILACCRRLCAAQRVEDPPVIVIHS